MDPELQTIPDQVILTTDASDLTARELTILAHAAQGADLPLATEWQDTNSKQWLRPEGQPRVGRATNVRVERGQLVADFTDVPRKIAEAIRNGTVTAFRTVVRLGGNFGKALKSISLCGLMPPADLAEIAKLFATQYADADDTRTYTLPQRRTTDAGWYPHKETHMANDSNIHATVEVDQKIKQYMADHPTMTYEQAFKKLQPVYPDLFRRYANERLQ